MSKKYTVQISRTERSVAEVEIVAGSEDEAISAALDEPALWRLESSFVIAERIDIDDAKEED